MDPRLKPGSCLLVALLARVIAVLAFPAATIPSLSVIFGGPIGDPTHWHQVAAEIALGEGIRTSTRPLYSLLLALPFQFFGYDVAVAKMMNALLDSASILCGYLIFRRLLPAPAPLVIALTLALLPNYIMFSHSLLTEHAGAAFLLAALVAMLYGASVRWWAFAGLLTGLSNLARPMTLFAIPFPVAVAFAFERFRFVKPLAAFSVALSLTLAPWLLVQYERHGFLSLSGNTSQVLYAATSPKYGRWSPAVEADKLAEGVSHDLSLKEWDRVFRRGTLENLRQAPLFWPTNVALNLWESLNDGGLWVQQPPILRVALAVVWMLCGLLLAWRSGRPVAGGARLILCSALVILGLVTGALVLLLVAGAVFVFSYARRCTILVMAYLVGCMFAHSLFGFSTALDRLGLMYAPLVFGLQAAAFTALGQACSWIALLRRAPRPHDDHPRELETPEAARSPARAVRVATVAAVIVLSIACARLAATYLWQRPQFHFHYEVSSAERVAVLEALRRARPDLGGRCGQDRVRWPPVRRRLHFPAELHPRARGAVGCARRARAGPRLLSGFHGARLALVDRAGPRREPFAGKAIRGGRRGCRRPQPDHSRSALRGAAGARPRPGSVAAARPRS